ncbi:MAG TPA: Asp-tRNA(Asn)/Glu-tRNA(Gln) amidotransferase subunit GatA [Candidatus Acidoferrales bacterium]|nr:Asp-tRNA(Asn)/Glu-tRNA(Gln) amidotransferase subunit GatA [Candidatus Acidoferrales bacterium]
MTDLHRLTIENAAGLLAKKEVSSVELTRAALERIRTTDGQIRSFITVIDEVALAQAHAADARRGRGETGPLLGIPVGIKDIILTKGIRTTAGSKILGNFIAPYDATVSRRLLDAGAVCVGKLNCDEFAMGSSTENSAYMVTRNPWDLERVPGGSSGGSAAAIAAAQCLGTLGTDTGGSIRQPAACCGVVGIKPTYGRVSRYGVVAYASSLDQVGPMAKTVAGCAHLLGVIAGHDRCDSTSVARPVPDYARQLSADIKGLRIGIPREYFVEGMQPEVEQAVRDAVRVLERLGAQVSTVSLPHTEYAVPAYYLIATAEASSNLARYDGIKYGLRTAENEGLLTMYQRTRAAGFGAEVKRRIMLGTYALSAGYYDAYYLKAQKVRTLIRRDFEQVFASQDVIVTPTAPTTAFRIGEKTSDPLQMYLSDIFTISVNLAGLPGLSMPCGFDKSGLPIGLQIVGRPFEEERVFQAAYAYEQATEWSRRSPGM